MIYTLGYQRLTAARLAQFVDALGAVLIDCRHRPFSQRPEFTGTALAKRFGSRYEQRGAELGGRGHVTPQGIARLAKDSLAGNVILMCMEEAPGDCHRHHAICWPAFPTAIHIFRDELITAKALQDAINGGPDAEYEVCGDISNFF